MCFEYIPGDTTTARNIKGEVQVHGVSTKDKIYRVFDSDGKSHDVPFDEIGRRYKGEPFKLMKGTT